jgi:FKBP-type peptidyl-prolyl cis-trans isomerase FklB
MQRSLFSFLIFLSFSQLTFAQPLETVEQQASYAIGTDLAKNLKSQGIELNTEAFLLGLKDVLNNQPLKLNEEQMTSAVNEFRTELQAKQQQLKQQQAKQNAEKSQAFLQDNKTKPGITTLDSGLQYKVIESGEGQPPKDNATIIAHYRGRLIDGTEFDSSYNRGTPIEFQLQNVIPGWQQALKLMKPGAKWEIYVPSELAYGSQGAGNVIGPNQALIFEIHFISTAVEKNAE